MILENIPADEQRRDNWSPAAGKDLLGVLVAPYDEHPQGEQAVVDTHQCDGLP